MFVSVCLTKEIPSERQSLKLQMPRDSVIIQNGPLITILFSLSDCPFWTAPRVSLSLSRKKRVDLFTPSAPTRLTLYIVRIHIYRQVPHRLEWGHMASVWQRDTHISYSQYQRVDRQCEYSLIVTCTIDNGQRSIWYVGVTAKAGVSSWTLVLSEVCNALDIPMSWASKSPPNVFFFSSCWPGPFTESTCLWKGGEKIL